MRDRGRLDQFVAEVECFGCMGSRLRSDAASVRYREMTIGDLVQMPLQRLQQVVESWKLDRADKKVAGELLREVRDRTRFLVDVGLGYLTLHRGAATLSGGEAQRIRLAAQLGSGLCGVLYVLDEPTIGLHPRDNHRLLDALHRLRDLGNTLLVVEHDRDVIAGSDNLCDFGPASGRRGGRIVARGAPQDISPAEQSLTGPYLTGQKEIPVPSGRRPVLMPVPKSDRAGTAAKPRTAKKTTGKRTAKSAGKGGRSASSRARFSLPDRAPVINQDSPDAMVQWLTVRGADEHNLRNIDVSIPLGVFTAVTGPSGSGKSTLIGNILYPALARRFHRARLRPGKHEKLEGLRYIDKVIRVDQTPLGNSPSSNTATYTGVFDAIRSQFASTDDAANKRLGPRAFSFNVPGGRCETCEGTGQLLIDIHQETCSIANLTQQFTGNF
ncbi:MAG: excinuclease ABC subunit A, partial [Planctomycetota bacterium]